MNCDKAECQALGAALVVANEVMNRLGDILNGMDAVMEDEEEWATPRFEQVVAALQQAGLEDRDGWGGARDSKQDTDPSD